MLRVEINNHSLFHRMYSASIKVSFQKKQFISQIANRDTVKSFNKQKMSNDRYCLPQKKHFIKVHK